MSLRRWIAITSLVALAMSAAGCAVSPLGPGRAIASTSKRLDLKAFRADGVSRTQVLVTFRRRMSSSDLTGFERREGVKVKRSLFAINSAVVSLTGTAETLVAKLKADPAVRSAEVDRALLLDDVQVNDPSRGQQYALDTVRAEAAWGVTMGSDRVTIAVVDTGVDLEHPDLASKLLPGYNTLDPTQPPKDDVGHGTHVAGIASALTNNGEGVSGLAANCKILPVKVLGDAAGSAASVADGILWAADHGADVLNLSLGFYDQSETLANAVAYALAKGVVVVATMGNDNEEKKRYPAAYPGVIAVGSTDASDERSSFSNHGDWMSVSAPGSNILSTFPRYPVAIDGPIGGYATLSGTSMAAPLVAGLCALLRSQHPGMAPADVKARLEATCQDLGPAGPDPDFGHGRIDALRAVSP